MTDSSKKPSTIEAYIMAAAPVVQEKLHELHATIRAAAPGAIENIRWRMPAYSYQKILVSFAVFKHHIGFYPMPSAMEAFAKELSKYKTGEGSVQFPIDQPLPLALIRKIVKFRVKESKDGVIKWRS